ncbi:MAG: NifU family protein [Clostridia bacterium]|nr:NifU family protein [Clostridia bacterium]
MKEFIEKTLGARLQGDGGWVEFEKMEDGNLTLVFRGECSKCLILNRCCDWIGQKVKEEFGMDVTVVPVRKKPYFWDK